MSVVAFSLLPLSLCLSLFLSLSLFEKGRKLNKKTKTNNSPALSTAANWSPLVTPAKGPSVVVNDCFACATAAVAVVVVVDDDVDGGGGDNSEKGEDKDWCALATSVRDRELERLCCDAAEVTADIDRLLRALVAATPARAPMTMREEEGAAAEEETDVDAAVAAAPPRACKRFAGHCFFLVLVGFLFLSLYSRALGFYQPARQRARNRRKGEEKKEEEREIVLSFLRAKRRKQFLKRKQATNFLFPVIFENL